MSINTISKSIHWGELKIESHLNITGRGEVVVVAFNTDLHKDAPFNVGDTFQYENQLCQITGVECCHDLLRGWVKSPVGIKFKRINE